jgi:hypothetical protein
VSKTRLSLLCSFLTECICSQVCTVDRRSTTNMSSIGKPVTEVERHWTEVEAVGCREHVRGFLPRLWLFLRHGGQRQTVEMMFTSCRRTAVLMKRMNVIDVLMFESSLLRCGRRQESGDSHARKVRIAKRTGSTRQIHFRTRDVDSYDGLEDRRLTFDGWSASSSF